MLEIGIPIIAAAAFGFLVGLAWWEIMLRRLHPRGPTTNPFYAPHPELGHVLRPNLQRPDLQTNSFGFRDREYPLQKSLDVYRIVGIGGSFTFGSLDPERNYLRVLERMLQESDAPARCEIINAGVPHYNTIQQLKHFKRFGLQFRPDLVLLGFFLGGHILENRRGSTLEVVDGELVAPPAVGQARRRWLRQLYAYRFLHDARWSRDPHADQRLRYLEVENARLRVCEKRLDPEVADAYRITFETLRELATYLSDQGIDLVVLLIPDEIQVDPGVFNRVVQRFSLDRSKFDLDLPNRKLREFCYRNGLRVVDILESCRARNKTEPIYLPENTHWNEVGNRIAAQELVPLLRERLLTRGAGARSTWAS